jgi:hypothetical protein
MHLSAKSGKGRDGTGQELRTTLERDTMKQADDGSRRCFLKASSMLGLAAAFGPATIGAPFADSTSDEANSVSEATATQQGGGQAADKTSIRPFHVSFPEAELTDLRTRVNATRWPERETVTDSSQGVQFATAQKLARYWATDHDWRTCEAKLNAVRVRL